VLKKILRFFADCLILILLLLIFVGVVRTLHVDLDEVKATNDSVTALGKEGREKQAEHARINRELNSMQTTQQQLLGINK